MSSVLYSFQVIGGSKDLKDLTYPTGTSLDLEGGSKDLTYPTATSLDLEAGNSCRELNLENMLDDVAGQSPI